MEGKLADSDKTQQRKKKSKSAKVAEKERSEERQRLINILSSEDLSENVVNCLKKEQEESGFLLKLNSEEIEEFWSGFHDFTKQQVYNLLVDDANKEKCSEVLSAIVTLLQYTGPKHGAVQKPPFVRLAVYFNLILPEKDIKDTKLKNQICALCEYCCLNKIATTDSSFYIHTINHLLDITLDARCGSEKKSDVKRMWDMHTSLLAVNLQSPTCQQVVRKLLRTVRSPDYLSCKEGRAFISFLFSSKAYLIKKLHTEVKNFLPKCNKSQASAYGEIYYKAWLYADNEPRKIIEKKCMQDLMGSIFSLPRIKNGFEMSQLGKNVFTILSHLHNCRDTFYFSKIITELYMPLIWRNIRSGNNIERCNAAEVFLDAYPFENPESPKAEQVEFLERQHKEMVDLLTDNCHVLRIIGIKGICRKLCSAWRLIDKETIQVLINHLLELANDGSDPAVRWTLYDSLQDLLFNPDSAAFLARFLPKLKDNIHDENEKVRRSYVKFLLAIKQMPPPAPITYWKIVNVENLAYRLENENTNVVGPVLCKLLMSQIYTSEMSVDKFLSRLTNFIQINPLAARKLFQFSMKVLDFKDASRVMLTILVNLRLFVKQNLNEASGSPEQEGRSEEESQDEIVSRRKKRRPTQDPLQSINEDEQNDSDQDSSETENKENTSSGTNISSGSDSTDDHEFSRPEVSHALIDIVSLLWTINSNMLAEPKNQRAHDDLVDVACAGIPLFLKYYKGKPTYFAVIHLASFIPAVNLNRVSTICSASISMLKTITEATPDPEIDVLVHALCSWNRWADIHDLISDWLDQAFRSEGLNLSKAPANPKYKPRRVRFQASEGKPKLALKLFDAVFSHPVNKRRVLAKSYNQVFDLFVFMERIKIVVERRLKKGEPLDSPALGDEFLQKSFYRYSMLMLILHRTNSQDSIASTASTVDHFDASESFLKLLQWTDEVIVPALPDSLEETPTLSIMLIKDFLRAASNLVDVNYADKNIIIKLATFIKKLLSLECRLWFIQQSMNVVKHMKDYCQAFYGPEDEFKILRVVLPSLLSQAVAGLAADKYSKEQVTSCVQNLNEMKNVMYEIVNCLRVNYGSSFETFKNLLKIFTDAVVTIISIDIKKNQKLVTVKKIQDLPFVCKILISLLTRDTIVANWLSTVPTSIETLYSQDANVLAAAASLLHTLAHGNLKLPKQELCQAVRQAYISITEYSEHQESTKLSVVSSKINVSSTTGASSSATEYSQLRESTDISLLSKKVNVSSSTDASTSVTEHSQSLESTDSSLLSKKVNVSSSRGSDLTVSVQSIDVKKEALPVLRKLALFLNITL